MSKVKAPLLSTHATGSLSKSLTFSKFRNTTVAKRIPTHPDARTLPQLYQRWRFVDARFYWWSLSQAQRDQYEYNARSLNMTGWAYFLSIYLKNPLDQVLWLRHDTIAAGITPDFSAKGNHGTVFGANLAPGIIDNALNFDGIDDYIECGSAPNLNFTTQFTTACHIYLNELGWWHPLIQKDNGSTKREWGFWISNTNQLRLELWTADGCFTTNANTTLELHTWYHAAWTYDGAYNRLYLNGKLDMTPSAATGAILTTDQRVEVGARVTGNNWGKGKLDEPRLYTRCATPKHIHYIATKELFPPL